MASISSIHSLTLEQPPCCLAFCPAQPQYFVVGTYLLHPDERPVVDENGDPNPPAEPKRTGSLILFRLDGDTITQISTTATESAILDLQWTPHTQRLGNLLAVANSYGLVEFYRLVIDNGTASLAADGNWLFLDDHDTESRLALSLAWHPHRPECLAITLSDGSVCYCDSDPDGHNDIWQLGSFYSTSSALRHELEAWAVAFVGDEGNGVLSGGDDAVLRYATCDSEQSSTVTWQDRRMHEAGVTALLPLTHDLVLTGSYDDHIRLISFPAGGRRQVRAELNLGGGVWRLKLVQPLSLPGDASGETSPLRIVADSEGCMYAGTRIVRLRHGQDGEWTFDVVAKFEEHGSMNYGSDVQPGSGWPRSIVSSSFYDKLLCLWCFDIS